MGEEILYLSSLEILKGVWAPKAILYFRKKFPFAGYEVFSSAESFVTLKYTWQRQMEACES